MSTSSAPSIDLRPRASRAARLALAAVAAAALVGLGRVDLPQLARLALAAASVAVAWFADRRLREPVGMRFTLHGDGSWLIGPVHGEGRRHRLVRGVVLGPLIALEFEPPRRLAVFPDSEAPDVLRRLRAWVTDPRSRGDAAPS